MSNTFIPKVLRKNSNSKISTTSTLPSYDLMIDGGFIRQLSSGIYTWLPLGVKVLDKIIKIIDQVMHEFNGQKIIMPCIQPASLWQESERYEAYGKEMLRITDRHENQLLFGPTHEEVVSDLFRKNVVSYKNFPKLLYQITTKFRDEIRPRFGVMRGREFLMKDGYSFDLTQEDSVKAYYDMYNAYIEIFKRIGVHAMVASAENGAIGGDMSHEFHILSNNGESTLYFDKRLADTDLSINESKELYCATDEKHNPDQYLGDLLNSKSIEVGHIFNFGLKYSKSMNITVQNNKQEKTFMHMGSYGIGVSRLVAAVIEQCDTLGNNIGYDSSGIIWPRQIAPFDISIINLDIKNSVVTEKSENLFKILRQKYDVLLDDSDESVGSKFATNDLIGIPIQIIVSERNLKKGILEIKDRSTLRTESISIDQIEEYLETLK